MTSGSLLKVSLLCLLGSIVRGSVIFAFSEESICSILGAIRIYIYIPKIKGTYIRKMDIGVCFFVCFIKFLKLKVLKK